MSTTRHGVAWSIIIIMFQPCARQANDFVERCSIDMLSESNRAAPEVDARRVATLTRFVVADSISSTHGALSLAREICASRQMPDPKSRAFRISPHARSMCRASVVSATFIAHRRDAYVRIPPNCIPSRARANPPPPPETRARRVERSRAC